MKSILAKLSFYLFVTGLVVSALTVVLHVVPLMQTWLMPFAALASFWYWAPVAWIATALIGVLWALLRRSWWLTLPIVAVVALGTWWHSVDSTSMWQGNQSEPGKDSITVLSLNTQFGFADVTQLRARSKGADVVVLTEFTPNILDALGRVGWGEEYPYSSGFISRNANGTMIFSKTPIETLGVGKTVFHAEAVRVSVRNVAWTIVGVHPVSPMYGVGDWVYDGEGVRALIQPLTSGHTIVVGDFNAIDDHYTMRRLYEIGYTEARHVVGSGPHHTWPVAKVLPPMIEIDHALVSPRVRANQVSVFETDGTDHKGLRVVASVRQ